MKDGRDFQCGARRSGLCPGGVNKMQSYGSIVHPRDRPDAVEEINGPLKNGSWRAPTAGNAFRRWAATWHEGS
jgi:hypothetical protein